MEMPVRETLEGIELYACLKIVVDEWFYIPSIYEYYSYLSVIES